jgi:iron complex transport system permease protein
VNTADDTRQLYTKYIARKMLFIAVSIAILFFLVLLSVSIGTSIESLKDLQSLKEVFTAIVARFFPQLETNPFMEKVIWHYRLPRALMGVVAGAGLAISGAVMQGVTRNPLVSPFTIGISSAAAFGAAIAIIFGVGFVGTGAYLIMLNAFVFALVCAVIVFGLAKLRGASPETVVLAGIALTYFFGSATAVLHYFASEEQLSAMVRWTFGTLSGATWGEIGIITAVLAATSPVMMKYAWDLNATFAGGDETAKSLGINISRVRTISLILSAFVTSTIISFTGIIGFVGLVAPHISRFLIGGDHRFLIPASCIIGSILVVGGDIVGRIISPPIMFPIGIVISFVGVPMFLYLMMTRKRRYWG